MSSSEAKSDYTVKELVKYALGEQGGCDRLVHATDVAVYLFEHNHPNFRLERYQHYPDVDKARVMLDTATKDRRGDADRAHVVRKKIGTDPHFYQFNAEGAAWFKAHRTSLSAYLKRVTEVAVRKHRSTREAEKTASGPYIERLRGLDSFRRFKSDPKMALDDASVPIRDFFSVFQIDMHTPPPIFARVKNQAFAGLPEGSPEHAFASELVRRYGDNYRTYLADSLAQRFAAEAPDHKVK